LLYIVSHKKTSSIQTWRYSKSISGRLALIAARKVLNGPAVRSAVQHSCYSPSSSEKEAADEDEPPSLSLLLDEHDDAAAADAVSAAKWAL
jgi:hypothetical protein